MPSRDENEKNDIKKMVLLTFQSSRSLCCRCSSASVSGVCPAGSQCSGGSAAVRMKLASTALCFSRSAVMISSRLTSAIAVSSRFFTTSACLHAHDETCDG